MSRARKMPNDMQSAVEKYQSVRPLYEGYALKLVPLIRDILEANNIKYQVVESRAKDVSSFKEKIVRPGKSYNDPLKEITDLCGCRVIVYYQDDVVRVAEAIKAEFGVSEENLSRQPQLLEVDRFGYLSAHYIVSIGKTRSDLTEWKPYADLVAEVQVRTVIQHAWSAVSHALQYKQEAAIPSKLQRRLYRIAGLFELADEEFVGLRNERESVRLQARRDLEKGDDSVALTAATISEFLATWDGSNKFVVAAKRVGFVIDDEAFEPEKYISQIYDTAVLAGISSLGELRNALQQADARYLERLWKLNDTNRWVVSRDFVVLLMLVYNARARISTEFLVARGFHEEIARLALDALDKSK
jgi:ppGpp synthetase/RelA/SpoT-type nucleotidyltranferase